MAPNFDRMFSTSAWLESIVYGINCVLFGACIYILAKRNENTHRIIYASCILHILIATVHNIITLLQVLEGFTSFAVMSVPGGSDVYFVTTTTFTLTNLALYAVNVFTQNLLLIWRLYVVWNHNWKLAIVSLIVEVAHIACGITAFVLITQPNQHLFSSSVQAFGKASWSLDLFLNTTVTSGIAYRLWRAGREAPDFTGRNPYKFAMITVIESGALVASCTVIMFALDIAGSPVDLMAVNVSVQITTTTPLLIIARLGGETVTHYEKSSSATVVFAPPVQITEEIRTYPMDSMSRLTQKTGSIQSDYCDV